MKENLRFKRLRLSYINNQKSKKGTPKIRVGAASSVLEQLTVVLLVSFQKTLNTFHTLS